MHVVCYLNRMQGKKHYGRQPRKPVQERGIETRERIIQAAKELFELKGYHGTNSKEVAAKAKVAVGTFYGYFKDKKPLFIEVVSRYYDEISESALSVEESDLKELGNPKRIIDIFIDRLLAAHRLSPDLHREIISMFYSDSEIRELISKKEEAVIKRLLVLFHIVKDKITVKDLEAAARIVHRTAEENIHAIKISGPSIQEASQVHELKEMLYRYLFLVD